MALDDNHESVVLACARAIQSVLSCDMNENYFDISEVTFSNFCYILLFSSGFQSFWWSFALDSCQMQMMPNMLERSKFSSVRENA
jgi:hypothetical protein